MAAGNRARAEQLAGLATATGYLEHENRGLFVELYTTSPEAAMQELSERGFDEQTATQQEADQYERHAVDQLKLHPSEIL